MFSGGFSRSRVPEKIWSNTLRCYQKMHVSFIVLIFQATKSLRTAHASMRSNVKHDRSRSSKPFIKYSSSLYFDNLWICNYIFVKVSELRIISWVTQRVVVRGLNLSLLVHRLGCYYMNLLPGYGSSSLRSLVNKLNCLFDTTGRH